jgi:hypothetical protein
MFQHIYHAPAHPAEFPRAEPAALPTVAPSPHAAPRRAAGLGDPLGAPGDGAFPAPAAGAAAGAFGGAGAEAPLLLVPDCSALLLLASVAPDEAGGLQALLSAQGPCRVTLLRSAYRALLALAQPPAPGAPQPQQRAAAEQALAAALRCAEGGALLLAHDAASEPMAPSTSCPAAARGGAGRPELGAWGAAVPAAETVAGARALGAAVARGAGGMLGGAWAGAAGTLVLLLSEDPEVRASAGAAGVPVRSVAELKDAWRARGGVMGAGALRAMLALGGQGAPY